MGRESATRTTWGHRPSRRVKRISETQAERTLTELSAEDLVEPESAAAGDDFWDRALRRNDVCHEPARHERRRWWGPVPAILAGVAIVGVSVAGIAIAEGGTRESRADAKPATTAHAVTTTSTTSSTTIPAVPPTSTPEGPGEEPEPVAASTQTPVLALAGAATAPAALTPAAPAALAPAAPPLFVCAAPADSTAMAVAVMGPCSRLTVDQLTDWFNAQTRPTYRAGAPVRDLVSTYVEEGEAEGVRGDIAFMQAIIETGWFSFGGQVPPSANNFAGIGATDGTGLYAVFPDVRTGVRAQIQHLRAYADATATSCTIPPLHHPCVDPRFDLVSPKGKAPTWNEFGNGAWASDPAYAGKVLGLYDRALTTAGLTLA